MSPLNRGGPLLGPRIPPVPLPRFGGRIPPPGIPPLRMPPRPPPMAGIFPPMPMRPIRQRMPPRPGTIFMRPGGPGPVFGPRINYMNYGSGPIMGPPMMGPRGPRGPPLRPGPFPGPRGMPPHILIRPKLPQGNNAIRSKAISISAKKASKLEKIELKKPWMTAEIRSEIQKKNKLYAKAKKSKDGKEWEEFKDIRNKVTRMIRDAKNGSEKKSENKVTSPVQKDTLNQKSSKLKKLQETVQMVKAEEVKLEAA